MKTFKEFLIEMYSKDYDRWKAFAVENSSFSAWQRANEYQKLIEETKSMPDSITGWDYKNLIKNRRENE